MKVYKKSPLAPEAFPAMLPVPGVELGAVAAGLRYEGRLDLMMAKFTAKTVAAGVFTSSKVAAAPVLWSRDVLDHNPNRVRGLVVNAGNANAFTGRRGSRTVTIMAESAARVIGCARDEVLIASTGVIGQVMAPAPLRRGIALLQGGLSASLYRDAAEAIRTTDTYAKAACRVATIDGQSVIISAIAKGSGMIAPNMATMLGFVFSNVKLSPVLLRELLHEAVDKSFNAITVDGDSSTNDSLFAFATGLASHAEVKSLDEPRFADYRRKFIEVCVELAQLIVRDGEGATKFVTLKVTGATSDESAKKIAKTIAESPLVKTAFAGSDPNWGRIIAAAGRAGEPLDAEKLQLWLGGQLVAHKGSVHLRYDEALAAEHMAGDRISICLDLALGQGQAIVWTCDFSEAYVQINADYRS